MTAPNPAAARRDAEEARARLLAADSAQARRYAMEECCVALEALLAAEPSAPTPLHFVCTDFPGPGDECVFVECEDGGGHGVNAGEWVRRPDGLVALVVTALPAANPCSVCRQPLARHRHGGPCSCRFCCNRPLPLDGDGRDGDNGAGPFEE